MPPKIDTLHFKPEKRLLANTDASKQNVMAGDGNQSLNDNKEMLSTHDPSSSSPSAETLNIITDYGPVGDNITATDITKIDTTHSTNLTSPISPGVHAGSTSHDLSTGYIVAIIITIVVIIALVGLAVWVFRRAKGTAKRPSSVCFQPIRKRRSSTTDSRATLDLVDDLDHKMSDNKTDNIRVEQRHTLRTPANPGSARNLDGERGDMFTIEDFDEEDEASRGDEYYYDEVFGQSQFEDEATQNSVRQLYSTAEDNLVEEELLDFDFETLGIKFDDKITSKTSTFGRNV